MNSTSLIKSLQRNWRYLIPFKRRIGYLGWVGHGNLGDEAILSAFSRLFPRYNTVAFKSSSKIDFLENNLLGKFYDMAVLGGGTLINESDYIDDFQLALKKYKTIVFGTGVHETPLAKYKEKLARDIKEWAQCLHQCAYVGVRGPLSKELLENAGYKNAEIIGDLALYFVKSELKRKQKNKILGVNIGITKGGLWGTQEDVLDKVVSFCYAMLSKGWKITFVPVWDKDIPYIEEAVKRLNGKASIFYEFHALEKTLNLMETFDVFVGEKLHSVILAMCAHTPSVMLEYRSKCLDFMRSMEMEQFNMRTDALSVERLVGFIEDLDSRGVVYQDKIFNRAHYYKNLLIEKAEFIKQTILR